VSTCSDDGRRFLRTAQGGAWLGVALATALGVACGREDVELAGAGPSDASQPEQDASAQGDGPVHSEPEAGPEDRGVDEPVGDAEVERGALSCTLPPDRVCLENGRPCLAAVECCSLRCAEGVCLEAGSCLGPGDVCSDRATCCSGRCEPVLNSTRRACLNYCLPDGSPCTRALDCCSMGCLGGQCVAGGCTRLGQDCTAGAECCSAICDATSQKCVVDMAAPCLTSGDDCEGPCCGALCGTGDRCDFGPGPCRPAGALCTQDSDCCRGTCKVYDTNTSVCDAPCLPDGSDCKLGADCCSSHCNGLPGKCSPSAASCKILGTACAEDVECCSAQCLLGSCGENCPKD
jgi:hypothetical protein